MVNFDTQYTNINYPNNNTSNKKAVLKPTENGLFRIVSIEEVDQSSQTAEADAEAGQNRTAESTQSAGSVKDAYTSVLQSISAHEPGFEFSIAGDSAESDQFPAGRSLQRRSRKDHSDHQFPYHGF